jgi:filamentous hemagglutinin family protein
MCCAKRVVFPLRQGAFWAPFVYEKKSGVAMVDALRGEKGPVIRSSSGQAALPAFHMSRIRPIALFVAAAFGAAAGAPSFANPESPKVVAGSATFSQHGSTLIIKNSPGAIINWQSFSIGSGQTTDFIQQSINSVVLNRVTGADPSVILGDLVSNGKVFLVNANGVVFGKGSMVDAAGLVVSTLEISNNDFAAGTMHFVGSGTPGDIMVAGVIRSSDGDVYLIAPNITNSGSISANNGEAILAAGQTVDIIGTGLEDIKFEVQNTGNKAINLGQISGDAVGIFAGSITQAGGVNANAASVSGGHIILSALGDTSIAAGSTTSADNAQGTAGSVLIESLGGGVSVANGAVVSASGAQGGLVTLLADAGTTTVNGRVAATGSMQLGGTVETLGQSVVLAAPAVVDVSGALGGGTALIGGARGLAVLESQSTTIAPGAIVNADATSSGDGGTISAYSTDTLSAYGTLSARGGVNSGNGGFIDTSAEVVDVGGTIAGNARSASGRAGTWLLDPSAISIDNGTGAVTPPSQGSEVSANGIAAVLYDGTSVTISTQTLNPTNGATDQTISLNAPIAVGNNSNAVSLSLIAGGAIVINTGTGISNSGQPLTLNLTSNADSSVGIIDVRAPLSLPNGVINISGDGFASQAPITARTFNATINAAGVASFNNASTIDASGASNGGGSGGTVTVNGANTGNVTGGTILANGDSFGSGGSIGLSGGNIIISGNLNADGGTFSTAPGGTISISAGISLTNAAGTFTVSARGGSGSYDGGSGGTIQINSDDTINLSGVTFDASGGAPSGSGFGGNGGQINMTAGDNIGLTNSILQAVGGSGGSGDPGGIGGSGGAVNVFSYAGTITLNGGATNVQGGAGGLNGTAYQGGAGGIGGTAFYGNYPTAAIQLLNDYTVNVGGGDAGPSANGGNAGALMINGGDINISSATIYAVGGAGGDGLLAFGTAQNGGGAGGNGGAISFSGSSIELTAVSMGANGGNGGNAPAASGGNTTYAGGNGGSGGTISLNTSSLFEPVASISIVGSTLGTNGGIGGYGSAYNTSVADPTDNTTGGFGGLGGTAGYISMAAYGNLDVTSSTLGATGGAGGAGGSLSGVGVFVAVGGDGGSGGMGGQITLEALSGDLTLTGATLISAGGNGGNGGLSGIGAGGGGNGGAGGDSYDTDGTNPQSAIVLSASGMVTVDATSVITSTGGIGGAGADATGTVQPNGTAYFLIEPGYGGNGGGAGGLLINAGSDISYDATTTLMGGNGGNGGNLTGTSIVNGYMIQAGNAGNGGSVTGLYQESVDIYSPTSVTVGGPMLVAGGNAGTAGNSLDQTAPVGAGGNGGNVYQLDFEAGNYLTVGGLTVMGGSGTYSGSGNVGNSDGNGGVIQPIYLYQDNPGGAMFLGSIEVDAGNGPFGLNGTGEIDMYAEGSIAQPGGPITTTGGTYINVNASALSVDLTNGGNQFEQISGNASGGSFAVFTNNYLNVSNVFANNAISLTGAGGLGISNQVIAGTGGYGGMSLAGAQITFFAPQVNAQQDTSYSAPLSITTDVLYAYTGGSYTASGGIQITTETSGRPIWLTADSYSVSGGNIYSLPELVIGSDFLAGVSTPALDIGNSSTGSILLQSLSGTFGTVTIPAGTQLGLTANSISTDSFTQLQVDALNIVSNNASIGSLTPSSGTTIALAGSALTSGVGASIAIGTVGGVTLIVSDNTAGPYPEYGLYNYDHVTLASDGLQLAAPIYMDGSPSSTITLETATPSANISLGGSALGYNLTSSDLSNIYTSGSVTFGSPGQGGTVSVQGPVDLPNISSSSLVTLEAPNGSISLVAGSLSAPGPLQMLTGGAITDPGSVVVYAASLGVEGASIGASGSPLQVDLGDTGANLAVLASNDVYISSPGTIYGAGINAGGSINISAPSIVNYYTISGAGINLTGSMNLDGTVESTAGLTLQGGNITIGSSSQSALVEGGNVTVSGASLTVMGPDSTTSPAATVLQAAGTLSVTEGGNVNVLGGAENGGSATIVSNGDSTYVIGGVLTLRGGSGNGAYALIDPTVPGSTLNISAGQINLSGGSGSSAYAAIVGYGSMLLQADSITFTTGSGMNADAVVVSRTSTPTAITTAPCPECAPTAGTNPITNSSTESGFYAVSVSAPPPPPIAPPAPAPSQPGVGEPLIDQIIGDLLSLLDVPEAVDNPLALPGSIYVDGGADGCL